MSLTHRRPQRAEARPLLTARTPAAHVLRDHYDVGKAPPAGMIGEGIVPPLTLGGGADVMARGLTSIPIGVAVAMGRTPLGAHADPPRAGHGG